ncbi:MAG: glycogen/starch/alpha-glucan phosphorylase [Planctomycetota bacterium]
MADAPSRPLGPRKTRADFRRTMLLNLYHTRGSAIQSASLADGYSVLSLTVRNYLIERWLRTTEAHFAANPKFVYYLSAEYLLGRQLPQNLLYTGTERLARRVLKEAGYEFEEFVEFDREPGLGNGGLGRLAACFLDSLATLDIPAVGYGIRYEFGIFKQRIEDGWQVEGPDDWLAFGNPWEFEQPDDMVEVGFGGRTERFLGEDGASRTRWTPAQTLRGEPYHMLVPGYGTGTVNLLRLWRARATQDFDFRLFDTGDFARAVEQKVISESISKVLYPNDNTPQGRELRLKQQYFFVACSLHDIIRRFRIKNRDFATFPDKVAIQLNDTHPVVAIPELMRLLIDVHGVKWGEAWDITTRTFAYTCHTLLPEALETWPVSLLEHLLPRHLEIIYDINQRFLEKVRVRFNGDMERIARMSLIGEQSERRVRMANLATVGSFSVNGVARLQSRLLRERTLKDFAEMWPERFNNKTNGVTPRRFMRLSNPRLSRLISSRIGDGWLRDLERLAGLEAYVEDARFRKKWRQVKRANKQDLTAVIEQLTKIKIDPDSVFDVMVKRLHEYKRQLLKLLHIVTLFHRIQDDPGQDLLPRTFLFGAKAAPGYQMAKLIIKLINAVAKVVNEDPRVADRLKVVFVPNFNVTLAQRIYPAADISEQISMAGKEASGTGNMKFALNGALTTGTLDGANIEIRERVGEENFFLFGLTAEQVFALKEKGYDPAEPYRTDPGLRRVIDSVNEGRFSGGDRTLFAPIVESLLRRDEYLLLRDYGPYVKCQDRAEEAYRDQDRWTRMSILNCARCGFFSSDRSMREYCEEIWKVAPVPVPLEVP